MVSGSIKGTIYGFNVGGSGFWFRVAGFFNGSLRASGFRGSGLRGVWDFGGALEIEPQAFSVDPVLN